MRMIVVVSVPVPVGMAVIVMPAGCATVLVVGCGVMLVTVVVVVLAHDFSTSGSQMTGTSPVATRRSSAAASRFVVSSGSAKE